MRWILWVQAETYCRRLLFLFVELHWHRIVMKEKEVVKNFESSRHERHLACLTIILVERKWVFLWCNRHRFSALARKKETFQFTESNLTDKSGLWSGFQRFSKQDLSKWIYSVESNCLSAVSVLASFSFVIYFSLLFFWKNSAFITKSNLFTVSVRVIYLSLFFSNCCGFVFSFPLMWLTWLPVELTWARSHVRCDLGLGAGRPLTNQKAWRHGRI